MKKRFVISVSNDISTDQRVRKQCQSLINGGYDVFLVGRKLASRLSVKRDYPVKRLRLLFNTGAPFYAELNIRLFIFLLFKRADYLLANDLDTLPANFFLSILKGKPLVYDSHEFFTEVPEIQGRTFVKSTWKFFEKWMINRPSTIITVNESIANLFVDTYGIERPIVVRNLPSAEPVSLKLPERVEVLGHFDYLIVLQGNGINIDRGGEELVEAMKSLPRVRLLIIGSGDAIPNLKEMTKDFELQDQILFFGRMPYEQMMSYTAICDLGLSLDKASNINYRYSLPNKIFDYAKAGIPVLASKLVEIERVFKEYPFGETIEVHNSTEIAAHIQKLLNDEAKKSEMKGWARKASIDLHWNSDFERVITKLKSIE